jgi:hypothetical protein
VKVLFWVPVPEIAAALDDLPGATVQVVSPDGGPLPASADDVEFYVPPFFPAPPAIEVIAHLPGLRVVQALTAGIDRLLPYIQPGVTLCNARGVHDASTAEWVVATILAAVRDLPYFALEQAAHRWSYRYTDSLAGKSVLIVGYGSIGAAVEERLAGFEVEVRRVARRAREGVARRDRSRAAEPGAPAAGGARPPRHPARGSVDADVGGAFARVRPGSGRAVHQRAATAERHCRELLTCHRCYGPFGRSSSIEA